MGASGDSSTLSARRVVVSGRVTGVAFRWHTRHKAEDYDDLRGWVRNLDRRTVECVVQGENWMVAEMVAWLRHGPPAARVAAIQVSVCEVDPSLASFHIDY
jgi:acylphosphatase